MLEGGSNLVAFSGGVDSTALFFLLMEQGIAFDIAIVDYGVREQSKEEVAYAKELAQRYKKRCFIHHAPPIKSNFEAKARQIRYTFFEQIIHKHHYDTLVTAHHLGDRLEWFLMQLSKGAGVVELLGMQAQEKKEHYTIVRPLLAKTKQELLAYLERNNIRYFEDESNNDLTIKRNYFRHTFSEPLLAQFAKGIQKSFEYLQKDSELLVGNVQMKRCNQLAYTPTIHKRSDLVTLDRYLKSLGHVMRGHEKMLFYSNDTIVVGRKYVVWQHPRYLFVAPYVKQAKMQKRFKEKMRLLQVEPKLRGYLTVDEEAVALLSLLLA